MPQSFEQLFQTCRTEQGAAYGAARTALLGMGAQVRAQLEAKAASVDWRDQLAASIIIGWLDRAALFEEGEAVVKAAEWSGEFTVPLLGRSTPAKKALVLASFGKDIVPLLLELLMKTGETLDAFAFQAIYTTLEDLGDARAVMPLIDLATNTTSSMTKSLALSVLGTLGDTRAFDTALAAFTNQGNDVLLRSSAAVCLGSLKDRRATTAILAAVQDQTQERDLRLYAAEALGELGDPKASTALAALLTQEQDLAFSLTLVDALSEIGDATALAALEQTSRSNAELAVREAAQDARDSAVA